MENTFFEKNGTMQGLLNFANNYQGVRSDSATGRLGALSKLLSSIVAIFV